MDWQPSIDLLVSRFSSQEFAIRRLYVHDPEFRAVCSDYCEVLRALEYWHTNDQAVPDRVTEYRQMLRELEAEMLDFLSATKAK